MTKVTKSLTSIRIGVVLASAVSNERNRKEHKFPIILKHIEISILDKITNVPIVRIEKDDELRAKADKRVTKICDNCYYAKDHGDRSIAGTKIPASIVLDALIIKEDISVTQGVPSKKLKKSRRRMQSHSRANN